MPDPTLLLALTLLSVVGEAVLATSLLRAAVRNHFKGHLRPAVIALGIYTSTSAWLNFMRAITRVFVLRGGDSVAFVDTWWYAAAIFFYAVSIAVLYGVLIKVYPDNTTNGPRCGI